MRMIDADATKRRVADTYFDTLIPCVNRALDDSPTVDAVPVVRCRECKYRFKNNGHSKDGCPIIDANIWMDDDDFCSHGERKEGADNG